MNPLLTCAWRVVLAGVILGLSASPGAAQLPVLEKYALDSLGERPGVAYHLYDQSFGGGDAAARIRLRRSRSSGTLQLRVWRTVRRGHISFALLGERVEVRGFDTDDTVLYTRVFDGLEREGIYFGDSRSGSWARRLSGIPPAVRRIEVTFYGNYE